MNRTDSPAPKAKATATVTATKDGVKEGDVQAGLPEVEEDGYVKGRAMFIAYLIMPRAICFVSAVGIQQAGHTALYLKKMGNHLEESGYLYLAAVWISFVVSWVNNYPGQYKAMIMRAGSGNLRANMSIYKEAGSGANAPVVILETEGAAGSYNRANRSLTHMTENSLQVVLLLILVGCVFSFPAFLLAMMFTLGRVLHQVGYSSEKGFGAHAPGFLLATFAVTTLEMLCLLIALQHLKIMSLPVCCGEGTPLGPPLVNHAGNKDLR